VYTEVVELGEIERERREELGEKAVRRRRREPEVEKRLGRVACILSCRCGLFGGVLGLIFYCGG
jgi:hypothetical protein